MSAVLSCSSPPAVVAVSPSSATTGASTRARCSAASTSGSRAGSAAWAVTAATRPASALPSSPREPRVGDRPADGIAGHRPERSEHPGPVTERWADRAEAGALLGDRLADVRPGRARWCWGWPAAGWRWRRRWRRPCRRRWTCSWCARSAAGAAGAGRRRRRRGRAGGVGRRGLAAAGLLPADLAAWSRRSGPSARAGWRRTAAVVRRRRSTAARSCWSTTGSPPASPRARRSGRCAPRGAARLVLAAPVVAAATLPALAAEALTRWSRCCAPQRFGAVSRFYADFDADRRTRRSLRLLRPEASRRRARRSR